MSDADVCLRSWKRILLFIGLMRWSQIFREKIAEAVFLYHTGCFDQAYAMITTATANVFEEAVLVLI